MTYRRGPYCFQVDVLRTLSEPGVDAVTRLESLVPGAVFVDRSVRVHVPNDEAMTRVDVALQVQNRRRETIPADALASGHGCEDVQASMAQVQPRCCDRMEECHLHTRTPA